MTLADPDIHAEQGFGQEIGFGNSPAVVVVDFQRGLTAIGGPLAGPAISRAVDASVELLDLSAELGVQSFMVRTEYRPDGSDAGVFGRKARTPSLLVEGSDWAELDDRLPRQQRDIDLVKKMPSAFFGTPLAMMLTAQGIDTLIVVGCVTSGCVRATAVDGMSHGFRVVIPAEGVGDRDDESHDNSLRDLQRKYADVRPMEEVLGWLRGR
ncbi:MAG: isochorismatase family protein [Nocardioidaceae bacterium]